MSDIHIERRHGLGRAKARAFGDKVAERLSGEFALACRWDGDVLHFSRSGVDGQVAVGDEDMVIDIRLGFLFGLMAPMIRQQIESRIDAQLARLPGRGAGEAPA